MEEDVSQLGSAIVVRENNRNPLQQQPPQQQHSISYRATDVSGSPCQSDIQPFIVPSGCVCVCVCASVSFPMCVCVFVSMWVQTPARVCEENGMSTGLSR